MHDLDDDRDPYPPPWYSGPPPAVTRDPVLTAYVDTLALDYPCPNPACRAAVGDLCRHDAEHGGRDRKMPCPKRIAVATQAQAQGEPR